MLFMVLPLLGADRQFPANQSSIRMMEHNNSITPRRAVASVSRLVQGAPGQLAFQQRETPLVQPGEMEGDAPGPGIIADHLEGRVRARLALALGDFQTGGHRIRASGGIGRRRSRRFSRIFERMIAMVYLPGIPRRFHAKQHGQGLSGSTKSEPAWVPCDHRAGIVGEGRANGANRSKIPTSNLRW